ncbi:pyridoxamine 5'-phosphate oxidase family protein [Caulobacter sp.]|uniref:pyridoxamine 5'-phosphate oxidase family protein n=1 Tax=Caulobacter sp. TaxID=78 RepID=UPI002B46AC27|nr:pyridoxamine 5'-phosphate oxidase family protein [Caulobacter sp.]HJV41791.1 pyridoxamine 5'-phosphate oxidase family protein [Caulobacter sp.]
MSNQADLAEKFWKALKSDRTVMLGLTDDENGRPQPMTAVFEGDHSGPIWIFSAVDVDLVRAVEGGERDALLTFASKGHDLFATVEGRMRVNNDRETIERLWNPFIAAWYDGKNDPKLRLLRFEPGDAQIWLNENSLFAGVKMMLGADPKKDYKDKVAEVRLQ